MGTEGEAGRKLGAAFAGSALVLTALSGCAAAFASAAIVHIPRATAPELQDLARRARRGDKFAQLDLGIRYEEGRGLPRDIKRAKQLYRLAAAATGGTIQVYSPPVGKGGGRLIPLSLGSPQEGLAEAKARLERLR